MNTTQQSNLSTGTNTFPGAQFKIKSEINVTTTISIKIKDVNINLTREDAMLLYNQLGNSLGINDINLNDFWYPMNPNNPVYPPYPVMCNQPIPMPTVFYGGDNTGNKINIPTNTISCFTSGFPITA